MSNESFDRAEKLEIGPTHQFARRALGGFLALVLAAQGAVSAGAQQPVSAQQAEPPSTRSQPGPIPDAPTPAAGTNSQPGDQNQQSSATQQPGDEPKPVGIAVAPYVKPSGVAASRPAGAAIAPAKQRRSHAIVIRVALIAGAAAAGGAIVALSAGSRSRP
jgi:hypothetical protein